MKIQEDQIIGELVAKDYRTATVFKKYSIDFCCQGDRTIGDACASEQIDGSLVLSDLNTLLDAPSGNTIDYKSWPLDLLADYIEKKHHRYVVEKTLEIQPYLNKICSVHGGRHPELFEIKEHFNATAEALAQHMKKEEYILFPYVRQMVQAQQQNTKWESAPFGSVQNPIEMMMEEHTTEGDRLRKIETLSNNYTPPVDACNTYGVAIALLKEFEQDLHLHIHLENNILFPKAIALEKELSQKNKTTTMSQVKKLWIGLVLVAVFSFSVLGYYGYEIYQQSPPVPEKIISDNTEVIFTAQEIKDGQNVWQSMGGQEVGTIWGHGAYVAPDWTADWLHREAVFILNRFAQKDFNKDFDALDAEKQAALKIRLQADLRTNRYDENTKTLTISANRVLAIRYLSQYYEGLFMNAPEFDQLRNDYAIPKNAIKDAARMHQMNAFFFWATWATVTERPNSDISYTHNWPADELVGNKATTDLMAWSGVSIITLILCIGLLVFYHAKSGEGETLPVPTSDPLLKQGMTPSMYLVKKYFWVVSLLMIVQMLLGIVTAHYGVEGDGLYGLPIDQYLPYAVTRTWHTQLAILWIATAWLATGLYIAPAVSGKDPKFQCFGINFLFIALLIIVVGSMVGQWFGVMQKLNLVENFWFGHQGYEYVDLGRFWQIFLLVGLFLWLALMVRPLLPILKRKTEEKNLIILFLISCAAIAMFYAAGLMWGRQTNLAIAEYWRWWVVHLWVEGFFEVFATVVIAFLFVRLGLLKTKTATLNVLFSTIVFLAGGILGTFHHLYFSGTPSAVMALGATFSALEVVPLTLIGYEAYHNYKLSKATEWVADYKWPIYFMLAVSFWNFLGAGIFGFIINPPIALYYVQGLNTTPLHGHTALFGVYGMLGIGLMLFVLRSLYRNTLWNTQLLKITFWSLNLGLLLMALLSLLPIGIWQAIASIEHGMWYARSAELMQDPTMITLKWMRTFGDVLFAVGIVSFAWFVFQLTLRKGKG